MSSEAGDSKRGPMVSGDLIARMHGTTDRNINLVRTLDMLTDYLATEMRARRQEDPPGDVTGLLNQYLDLCEIHLKAFRSLGSLQPALVAFKKELADLVATGIGSSSAAGTEHHVWSSDTFSSYLDVFDEAMLNAMESSSKSDTVGHDQDNKAPGLLRSRI